MSKPRSNTISLRQANWRETHPRPARPQRGPTWGATISSSAQVPADCPQGSEYWYVRHVHVHAPDEIQARWEARGLCKPGEEVDEIWRVGPERQYNHASL